MHSSTFPTARLQQGPTTTQDVAIQPLTHSGTWWYNRTFGVLQYNIIFSAATLQLFIWYCYVTYNGEANLKGFKKQ